MIINLITVSTHDGNNARAEPSRSEAAFVASMNGLDAFTCQAARELSPYGIHVYAVKNIADKIVEDVFALLDLQMEER